MTAAAMMSFFIVFLPAADRSRAIVSPFRYPPGAGISHVRNGDKSAACVTAMRSGKARSLSFSPCGRRWLREAKTDEEYPSAGTEHAETEGRVLRIERETAIVAANENMRKRETLSMTKGSRLATAALIAMAALAPLAPGANAAQCGNGPG